jgi:alpha-tubulin suppressor-like RCC1 family protein
MEVRETMSGKHTSIALLLSLLGGCDSGELASHRVRIPARLAFTTQPTPAIAGAAIRPAVEVTVQDAHGNTVTDASSRITVALGNNPGGGALSGTVTVAAVNGVASFPDLNLDRSGRNYTLTAGTDGLSGITSDPFDVSLAPAKLVFAVQPSTTAPGKQINPGVQLAVLDPQGNLVESASTSVTLAIGTNPSGGSLSGTASTAVVNGIATFSDLSIDTPGTGYTLTASATGLNGASSAAFVITGVFSSVSSGGSHSCGISVGVTYCWGHNERGQLGDGSTADSRTPVPVSGAVSFTALSAGSIHTCGLTSAGEAYCWGENIWGQLGNGSLIDSATPVPVTGGLKFTAVSAAADNTCAITTAGEAYCWGGNTSGQLGNGSLIDSATPFPVTGGLAFVALTPASVRHGCGLTAEGEAYCWGSNDSGQLGNGVSDPNDDIYSSTPVPVGGGLTFASLSAGAGHSCGLTSAGEAYCWGDNTYGQLGNGSNANSSLPVRVAGALTFVSVSAGLDWTCGLTTDGAAYCWGANYYGQLGNGSSTVGSNTVTSTPVAVAGGLTFTVLSAGANGQHTCGVTKGFSYCWGEGDFGQLGNGSTQYSSTPVRISSP